MKCVYLHINETGVFYVGCGSKKRPQMYGNRSALWKQAALSGYSVWIVGEFETKQEAWKHEKELISYFKPPCNRAKGGQGPTGITWTPKARDKISVSRQGEGNPIHKLTKEQVLAIREDLRTQRTIAEAYRITHQQVSRIKSRKSWSHVV